MSSQRVYVFASDEIGWPVVRRTIERLPDRFEVEMTTGSYAALGPLTRWCPDVILTGRWVEGHETAELLAPYAEWQGLAGEILLLGWSRGLVPGASADRARIARRRERRAA